MIKELDAHKGSGEVQNISFSNKGLQFAATLKNMENAKLFNMRKIDEPALDIVSAYGGSKVNAVTFDYYGGHLMAGNGKALNFYNIKAPT